MYAWDGAKETNPLAIATNVVGTYTIVVWIYQLEMVQVQVAFKLVQQLLIFFLHFIN